MPKRCMATSPNQWSRSARSAPTEETAWVPWLSGPHNNRAMRTTTSGAGLALSSSVFLKTIRKRKPNSCRACSPTTIRTLTSVRLARARPQTVSTLISARVTPRKRRACRMEKSARRPRSTKTSYSRKRSAKPPVKKSSSRSRRNPHTRPQRSVRPKRP